MKCIYSFPTESVLTLPGSLRIKLGHREFELAVGNGIISHLAVTIENYPSSLWPKPHLPSATWHYPPDPILDALLPEIRTLEGALSIRGIRKIDTSEFTTEWLPETDVEKKEFPYLKRQFLADAEKTPAKEADFSDLVRNISRLVESYNALALSPLPLADQHHPMRVIAVRRQILASLLELKGKLDERIGQFRRDGLDCSTITAVRKTHRPQLDNAEGWRAIRNLTFHFGDVTEPHADLVATYTEVDQIKDAEVNAVWSAVLAVGAEVLKVASQRT